MKKILFSLCLLCVAFVSCSVPQTAVMDEIRKIDNIQSTRVPMSLINSLTGLGDLSQSIPGVNLAALKNVSTIDVMNITDNGAKNKARKLLEQFYKGNTYELVFQAKQNLFKGASIYGLPAGNDRYSSLVIINDNTAEITIVELRGNMSMDDLNVLKNL